MEGLSAAELEAVQKALGLEGRAESNVAGSGQGRAENNTVGAWSAGSKEYSVAKGAASCIAESKSNNYSPSATTSYIFVFKIGTYLITSINFGGSGHPGTKIYLKVDDVRFSANEDDSSYWANPKLIKRILNGKHMWAEWVQWPNEYRSGDWSLMGITSAYNECVDYVNSKP